MRKCFFKFAGALIKRKINIKFLITSLKSVTVRIIKSVPKAAPKSCSGFLALMSLFSPVYIQAPAIKNNFQDNNHERLSKQLFELQAAIGKLEQAPRRGLLA